MNEGSIKIKVLSIFFVWVLVCAAFAVFVNISKETAGADIWIVDQAGGGNFTTIQDAINDSNDGDMIYVWAGTYIENVVVNKSVSLIGNGSTETVINGSDSGDGVHVVSDWVNISGFNVMNAVSGINISNVSNVSVQNCEIADCSYCGLILKSSDNNTISDNDISNNEWGIASWSSSGNKITGNNIMSNDIDGIWFDSCMNNTIYGNNITSNGRHGIKQMSSNGNTIDNNNASSNSDYGIYLWYSDSNTINNNTVSDNQYGIRLDSSSSNAITNNTASSNSNDGIYILGSNNNTIANNTASSNSAYGICLPSSNNNTIANNTASSNNDHGIYLWYSDSNTIANNTASSNSAYGIYLYYSNSSTFSGNNIALNADYGIYLTGSDSNEIYHNNIIGNTNQSYDDGTNSWNMSYAVGGNYWDDWTLPNDDGDRWVDIPRDIAGGANQDKLPWADPYGWTLPTAKPVQNLDTGEHFTTIQEAIDDVDTIDGHTIWAPSGKYYENPIVNKTITLVGNGSTETIIDANALEFGINVVSNWVNISGFKVVNAESGINISDASNVSVQNCEIADCSYYGLILYYSDNNTISDNDISNNQLGIASWSSSGNKIKGNNITFNDYDGISFDSCMNNTIYGNNITSNGGNGIKQISSNGNTINNNTVSDNWNGIRLESSSSNTIANNTVSSNNYLGIRLESSSSNTIANNNASSNNNLGIYLDSSSSNTIANNNASSNSETGILLGYSTNNTIANNTVSDNWYGICLSQSNNNIIANNNASSNNEYGIYLWYSNSNTIANNTASSNSEAGIYLWYSNSNTIVNNTASSNRDGIYLDYSNNNTIANNTASSNGYDGIWLVSSSRNTITNNTVSSNSYNGIYLFPYSDNNTIANNTVSDNGYGICLSHSNNNTIANNTASSNNYYGICLSHSNNNTIANNTASSNGYDGIHLSQSNSNTIANNIASSNSLDGIQLYSSDSNTIANNIASSNSMGIYIRDSDSNEIYHNNIMGNTNQAYDDGTNSWNLPYPQGGNFWSDYTGKDSYSGINQDIFGSDGLGDTPYNISGGTEKDHYPLLRPILPIEGDILIISHKEGDYVSGTIVVEAAVTFTDLQKVNFYINGVHVLSDDSYPYQCILDTTEFPEDVGFNLKAVAIVYPYYTFPTTITLISNNLVQTGNYIIVSTLNSEYQPDEDVSVLVSMVSPPAFESLELEVNCVDPSGHPLYTSAHSFPYGTEFRVIMSLPSDAELGTYTVSVEAIGFVDDSMVWNATDSTTFLVSGMSLRDQLEELNQTLSDLNMTELINTLDQMNQNLSSLDLTELLEAIDYLNQTLPVKIDDLSLQLSGVNDSLQSGISSAEINLLGELAGVNATLANDIQNLLASITTDIIGMNSSLADQLTNLLNTMTTDNNDLRMWLETVLDEIDTNLTDTKTTLSNQIEDLNIYMEGFNDGLKSDLGNISARLELHDQSTGQNHTIIQGILDDISEDIETLDLDELKAILTDLAENISATNQSLADDILKVVGNIGSFESNASQELDGITATLADLDKLNSIITDLEQLDQNLDDAEANLEQEINEIPTDKEEKEGFGVTEILLIIVLILLVINLLLMLIGRKGKASDLEKIPEGRVEPQGMAFEKAEPKEESVEVEEGELECLECGTVLGPGQTVCPKCGAEYEIEEYEEE